jgi:hypothetical protein
MRRRVLVLAAAGALGGAAAAIVPASGETDEEAAPIYGIKIPPGYRDWQLISVAREDGNFNQLRAQLGNDIAIKAYRDGTLPFPDGSIIVALHWDDVASDEDNKVFGRAQAFVAGPSRNIQFMVKDSKKYAATGGQPAVIGSVEGDHRPALPAKVGLNRLLAGPMPIYSASIRMSSARQLG